MKKKQGATYPDLSSTHSLKLDARYLLRITHLQERQHATHNAHNDAVVVRHIECSRHPQAVINRSPCESVRKPTCQALWFANDAANKIYCE
jgi:hypothetical protein